MNIGTPVVNQKEQRFDINILTPVKDPESQPSYRRNLVISGRVLRWDENEISLGSRLSEMAVPPASPYLLPTPVTLGQEVQQWLARTIDEEEPRTPRYLMEPLVSLFQSKQIGEVTGQDSNFLAAHFQGEEFSKEAQKPNKVVSEVGSLYGKLVEVVVAKEQAVRGQAKAEHLAQSEGFQRVMLACCAEAVLFVYDYTSVSFEEILKACQVSPFEFWKVINSFLGSDENMPQAIKRHFREIEVKILSFLGWKKESPVYIVVTQVIQDALRGESEDFQKDPKISKHYQTFFKKVLGQAAHVIQNISTSIGCSDLVKEEIWTALKYLLSEQTELLVNRHLDQIILSTIYAIAKINSDKIESTINFSTLISKYSELYKDQGLFKKVLIEETNYADIIQFYNKVYIPCMKDYLTHKAQVDTPRISALSPLSPLREALPAFAKVPSPILRSPNQFLTPRTQKLWAFGETLKSELKIPMRPSFDISEGGSVPPRHVLSLINSSSETSAAPQLKNN